MRAGVRSKIGDWLDDLDRGAARFGAQTFNAPQVGAAAPDFTLPGADGEPVSLADLRGNGRVVVVFHHGAWSPYCHIQLTAFEGKLAELKAAGAELVAISSHTPDASRALAQQWGYTFTMLSDAGNEVADSYGLRFTLDGDARQAHERVGVNLAVGYCDDSWTMPAASTFVIEADGTVSYAFVSGDWRWRVGPTEVLAALETA